jgi:FkbM family methyltransferase
LKPGMIVLDIGAHHGLYTLLAAKRVGRRGKVIAFEPSRRERRALYVHLVLNHCWNVSVQKLALGRADAEADFNVVQGEWTGCNSLRPIALDIPVPTQQVRVRVARLDEWLRRRNIDHVDFIKLDVEGGELDALEGAGSLLDRSRRPVILAEVQDVRTRPWGYTAKDLLRFLEAKGYSWFGLSDRGSMTVLDTSSSAFEGNYVAVPNELLSDVRDLLEDRSRPKPGCLP